MPSNKLISSSDNFYRQVLESMTEGVSLSDESGNIVYTNPAEDKIFGYKSGELVGQHVSVQNTYKPAENKRIVNEVITQLKKTGVWYGEFRNRKKDGTPFITSARITALEIGGKPHWMCVQEDITDRKNTEEMLRESEERFALAQQAANIGTFEWNILTEEFVCTPQLEALYGLPPNGLKGEYENWLKMLHHEDRARVEADLQATIKGKRLDTEFRIIKPDGATRWIAVRARVFKAKNGQPERLVGINRNVTKRKEAEERLRTSEERLRFMSESMPQKIFTAKPNGDVDYFNPQWMEYTGLTFEQIKDWGWQQFIHPDDVDGNIRAWQHSINTGEPFEFEHRFRNYKGEYRWHYSRALAMRDKNNDIIMWIGSNTDIEDIRRTNTRKNELEIITATLTKQREQLVELNKAKDEFISVASHQLRTPATGVKQYLGMLLEGYAGALIPEQEIFLRNAYESNERQINIVNDLLKVATVDAGKVVLNKETTDLVALIRSIIKEQSSKIAARSQTVVFIPPSKKIVVEIDVSKMRMVLENIIDNASKYTYEHKTIEIIITRSKDWVSIATKDEGVGIDKPDQKKIFRKFSIIDNPLSVSAGGTGIGLYWAKNIVKLHGGTIEVDSILEKGSTFTVKIPASAKYNSPVQEPVMMKTKATSSTKR